MLEHHPKMFLIYGHSGVGKTSLALTAPEPLLVLDVEHSSAIHDIPEWEPNEVSGKKLKAGSYYVKSKNILKALKEEETIPGQFNSIVFDSITKWQRDRARHCTTGNRYGQGGQVYAFWNKIYEDSMSLLDRLTAPLLRDNPAHVIITAQEHRRTDEQGNVTHIGPSLYGQARGEYVQAADLVGQLSINQRGDRFLLTELSSKITAKHRSMGLLDEPNPYPISLDKDAITEILKRW